jgi:hypothetical protein
MTFKAKGNLGLITVQDGYATIPRGKWVRLTWSQRHAGEQTPLTTAGAPAGCRLRSARRRAANELPPPTPAGTWN